MADGNELGLGGTGDPVLVSDVVPAKRDSADTITAMKFEMRRLSWIILMGPISP